MSKEHTDSRHAGRRHTLCVLVSYSDVLVPFFFYWRQTRARIYFLFIDMGYCCAPRWTSKKRVQLQIYTTHFYAACLMKQPSRGQNRATTSAPRAHIRPAPGHRESVREIERDGRQPGEILGERSGFSGHPNQTNLLLRRTPVPLLLSELSHRCLLPSKTLDSQPRFVAPGDITALRILPPSEVLS